MRLLKDAGIRLMLSRHVAALAAFQSLIRSATAAFYVPCRKSSGRNARISRTSNVEH